MRPKLLLFVSFAIVNIWGCNNDRDEHRAEREYFLKTGMIWERYFCADENEAMQAIKELERMAVEIEHPIPPLAWTWEVLLVSLRGMDLYCYIESRDLCVRYISRSSELMRIVEPGLLESADDEREFLLWYVAEMNGDLIPLWKKDSDSSSR